MVYALVPDLPRCISGYSRSWSGGDREATVDRGALCIHYAALVRSPEGLGVGIVVESDSTAWKTVFWETTTASFLRQHNEW